MDEVEKVTSCRDVSGMMISSGNDSMISSHPAITLPDGLR